MDCRGLLKKPGSLLLSAARLLAPNAHMGVVVALATHERIDGALPFAVWLLATNARMGVVVALATHSGIYGAVAARFLARNARMGVGVALALATHEGMKRKQWRKVAQQ